MYQALYRKYRPKTFDDVVGQQGVTQTLKNQLITGRLSHAYLFTGSRGTGKTSCACILAKAVNCEHPVDGNPCNVCAACRSIESGACTDVLEIDAASNNSVDNVRSLRDDAVYLPAEVKKRVYIIDEVHMLSNSAFNALLKIIEEPPEHLLFILATTELHKIPATILSRCQRFAFRRLLPEDIGSRLQYIAGREGIDLAPDAAAFLARLADGGMRDAVSLLDQCASAATGRVTTEQVCTTLGLAGTRRTAELLQAVAAHRTAQALSLFEQQYAEGKDLAAMLDELCTVARDLLILNTAPKSGLSMLSGICTEPELRTLQSVFSPGELLRITRLLRDAAAGFQSSANRRIDAELCIIRLCEPEAALDADALGARISRLEARLAAGNFAVSAPSRTPDETAPPEEESPWEAPPECAPWDMPGQDELPAEVRSNSFWPEFVQRARSALRPPVLGYFSTNENAPIRGTLTGDVLELHADNAFVLGIVDRPPVMQTLSEVASAIAGRSVAVRFGKSLQQSAGGGLERLIERGEQYPDIIEFK